MKEYMILDTKQYNINDIVWNEYNKSICINCGYEREDGQNCINCSADYKTKTIIEKSSKEIVILDCKNVLLEDIYDNGNICISLGIKWHTPKSYTGRQIAIRYAFIKFYEDKFNEPFKENKEVYLYTVKDLI